MKCYYKTIILLLISFAPSALFAKGATEYEFTFTYHYDSGKGNANAYSTHELDSAFLVPYGPFFVGGEVTFIQRNNPAISESIIELGGLAKYWFIENNGTVGFNIFIGAGLGKQEFNEASQNTTAIKIGPEIAWFVAQNAAVSTRLQYSMRKAEEDYTSLGVLSGISLFF